MIEIAPSIERCFAKPDSWFIDPALPDYVFLESTQRVNLISESISPEDIETETYPEDERHSMMSPAVIPSGSSTSIPVVKAKPEVSSPTSDDAQPYRRADSVPFISSPQNEDVGQDANGRKLLVIKKGSVVDKYRIDGMLGRGGFAVVYLATHLILQTKVALKVIKPKMAHKHPQLVKMMCEEARFAAQVNHPNIVQVIDATDNPVLSFIVMEYIDGDTAEDLIKRGKKMSVHLCCTVAQQVCAGLDAALQLGMIHRDIKPANIMINEEENIVKIVDLGLATQIDVNAPGKNGKSSVVGTPKYMSPEQAVDPDAVDYRSDMYSLGVTLFCCLTGKSPYDAETPSKIIYQHINEPVPMANTIDNTVPKPLANIISQMMAKNPDDRPSNYRALANEFQRLSDRYGPESDSGIIKSWMRRVSRGE